MILFFFKQKTAYEMRISDWSSDVCSSDLAARSEQRARRYEDARKRYVGGAPPVEGPIAFDANARGLGIDDEKRERSVPRSADARRDEQPVRPPRHGDDGLCTVDSISLALQDRHRADIVGAVRIARSEEHTSELQSLMSISYAVFCLKQKNTTDKHN